MSDIKNQDYTDTYQRTVQKSLNAPDFAKLRDEYLAFFQADAAQFEQKVPSENIIQVKKIFKLIKEIDLPAFKLLKSMRTAIGVLDKSDRNDLYEELKSIRAELKVGKLTANAAHALIYLMILEPLRLNCMTTLFSQESGENIEHILQDPHNAYIVRCFVRAYLILLSDCDPAHWSLVSEGSAHPRLVLDQSWVIASVHHTAIDFLAANKSEA